ncbi:MAG: hypothetical protein ACE5IR_26500 [bacterium]
MKTKLSYALVTVLAVMAVAFSANDAIRLVWKPKVGSSAEYTVVNVLTTPFGSKVTHTWTTVKTVEKVVDGMVILKAESTEPKVEADGPTGCPIKLAGPNGNITFSLSGKYLPADEDRGSMSVRFGNLSALVFPGDSITEGSEWVHEVKSNPETGDRAAKSTYKFLGTEKIAKWDTYKIAIDYHETEGDEWDRFAVTGAKWISVEDGSLVLEKLTLRAPYGVETLHMAIETKRVE